MEGTTTWTRCSSSATAGSAARSRRPPAIGDAGGDARRRGAPDPRRRPRPATVRDATIRRDLAGADLVVEASRGDAVVANLAAALEAGCRRVRHRDDRLGRRPRRASSALLREHGAAAVAASNFSLGVVAVRAARRDGGRAVRPARRRSIRTSSNGIGGRSATGRPGPPPTSPRRIVAGHPRLATADDLEVVSVRAGRIAGDAPRRLRRRRRDRRAAADRARPIGLRRRDPRRRRLARPRAARTRPPRLRPHRRRAHRSPTPSLPERTDR